MEETDFLITNVHNLECLVVEQGVAHFPREAHLIVTGGQMGHRFAVQIVVHPILAPTGRKTHVPADLITPHHVLA